MPKAILESTAKEIAASEKLPPVTIPPPVRYFVVRARQGATVNVLRDNVTIATFEVDGPHTLANVMNTVRTSVASDGDARFAVCIDGQEVDWQTNSFDLAPPKSETEAQALRWAASMEGFAMRSLQRAMDAIDQTHKHAQQREASLAKLMRQQAKTLKLMARAIRKNGAGASHDVELARIAAESEEQTENMKLLSQFLPMLTGGATGGGAAGSSGLAQKVLGLLKDDERAAVMQTDEGRMLQAAHNDTMAGVALRALFLLVKEGQLKLSSETISAAMAMYNGG